ncbi:MAG: DNA polymerase-1, partial [Bermanella sp.]
MPAKILYEYCNACTQEKNRPMTTNTPQKVILVDGSSYLFRAFHAIREMNTSKGFPTNAIRGVVSMVRKLQKDYSDAKIVVIFDAKGKTFRNDLYSEYKANRPPMPDDLRVQIQPIHDIIEAMGLPLIVIPGVEADDVIGTLAKEASEKGIETIVSTGDKDMAQLVTEHVTLMNTMTDTFMDVPGVSEKFGVRPDQIIDYLALMGDKVDNIPGVDKCGPKTAVKWLDAYGTLDGVIENADQVKGKVGENLREALERLPLSYQLATIKCDVELEQNLDQIQVNPVDTKALVSYFTEYEFKTWTKELSTGKVVEEKADETSVDRTLYTNLSTEEDLLKWVAKLKAAPYFAFDTETTSLDYMKAEIVGVSFATAPNEA